MSCTGSRTVLTAAAGRRPLSRLYEIPCAKCYWDRRNLSGTAADSCCRLVAIGRADARLRQLELHAPRCIPVAGDGADDRARLLVSGQQQKRRRAAVTLHSNREEISVGMLQLLRAVRSDRSAAVNIRIDERCERPGTLYRSIQIQPNLREDRPVGP